METGAEEQPCLGQPSEETQQLSESSFTTALTPI